MENAERTYDLAGMVSMDARGQIVLPKEVRAALGLEAGAKLAVVLKHTNGAPCCVNLVPAPALQEGLRAVIDPEAKDGEWDSRGGAAPVCGGGHGRCLL